MKIQILKKDLDKAMSVPWSVDTCLIAQVANRLGIKHKYNITGASNMAKSAMNKFDDAFGCEKGIGKRATSALTKLRTSLPITVTLP